MADAHDSSTKHDEYRRTRDAFDRMNVEEQASFLVEATASMLARGVEEVGRTLADGLDDLFRARGKTSSSSEKGKKGPGPAEPETAQQRRPTG